MEVTAECLQGLLLELNSESATDTGAQRYTTDEQSLRPQMFASLLQSAFRQLVARDLELDTVCLSQDEALDLFTPESSSAELIKWSNDSTTNVLRLEDEAKGSREQEPTSFSIERAGQFLGLECAMGTLLPRTGLLECFDVEIRQIYPTPAAARVTDGACEWYASAVHLALILRDYSDVRQVGAPVPSTKTNTKETVNGRASCDGTSARVRSIEDGRP